MPKITIGFSKPKKMNPISWLIMLVNRTPFSHTYVKIHSASLDRDLIYQAHGTQVNFVGNTRFLLTSVTVSEFIVNITEEQKTLILQFCVDNAGMTYGFAKLFGMLYVEFMKVFKVKVKNPFHDGLICAEVITLLLILIKVPIKVTADTADLNDVWEAMRDLPC